MNIEDLINNSLETADHVCLGYLGDLTDEDLMRRPHPGCNHLNWQVGHLIVSEHELMSKVGSMPPLPDGFANRYRKETCGSDRPSDFCRKDELLSTQKAQRQGTLALLGTVNASDLDKPTGIDYAPTVGAILNLIPAHWLMHAGQWVIVRRELGHPPLF